MSLILPLYSLQSKGLFGPPLHIVTTNMSNTENWSEQAREYVDMGYEGVVLRKIDSPWIAKRSVSLLKFKPTEEDEYLILEVQEAISQEGEHKGMVGSFTVTSDTHEQTFNVGAGRLSHEERIAIWERRRSVIGKYLITKHEKGRTSGDIPLCTVAIKIR